MGQGVSVAIPTNTIRIVQTHDAAGAPAPAEFAQIMHNASVNTMGWDVMQFLKPLTPVRTTDPLVYLYTDPARGSGWLRLEGFRPADAARVQELVQLDEVSRAIGEDPIPKDDLAVGRGALLRSNNPWAFIVLGAVVLLFPGVMWLRSPPAPENVPGYLVMAGVLVVLGAGVLVVGILRARWWHRARRHVKSTGQTMPTDLRGGM